MQYTWKFFTHLSDGFALNHLYLFSLVSKYVFGDLKLGSGVKPVGVSGKYG